MKVKKMERGFSRVEFTDRYGRACSLQESSLATEAAIWFGCNAPDPKIMTPEEGWQPYLLPATVMCNTRMHLTRKLVKQLLPYLQKFAETGELK